MRIGVCLGVFLGLLAPVLPAAERGHWTRYQSEHVTVLSKASDRATRGWIVEFEQIYAGLASIFPALGNRQPPLTVLAFADSDEFKKYRPLSRGEEVEAAGYFSQQGDRGIIALDLGKGSGLSRRLIYHEAVHWFFSVDPKLRPKWLEEGMAELFSTARIEGTQFTYGQELVSHLHLLQFNPTLDVAIMLRVTDGTAGLAQADRAIIFYATSWLFLHYVVCSPEGGGLAALQHYRDLLEQEISPEEAFRQAFGCDYAAMDQKLNKYVGTARTRTFSHSLPAVPSRGEIRQEVAGEAEANYQLGCLLMVAGRYDQARGRLQKAATELPRDPRVQQALAILAINTQDFEAGRAGFARAAELGASGYFNPYGQVLAELAYRQDRGAKLGQLSAPVARVIADGMIQTIALEPGRERFYAILSQALKDVEVLKEEEGRMIEEGWRRFPYNPEIRLGYALYLQRLGREEEAKAVFAQIKGSPRQIDPVTRDEAAEYLLKLQIRAVTARYQACTEARDWVGAVAAMDERIALRPGDTETPKLRRHRAELMDRRDLAEFYRLQREGKAAEGRPLLERMIRESPTPVVRGEAEKLLRELPGG